MIKKIQNTLLAIAFIPLLAIPTFELHTDSDNSKDFNQSFQIFEKSSETNTDLSRKEKALKIEKYMKDRSMPLFENAMQFVLVSEKYGLPYNLLPAISIRESSGGKNLDLCGYNPFGWGSCRKHNFHSFNEAIEVVGKNLGGGNKSTASYYSGKETKEKLYYYNGTVIPTYQAEVMDIMQKINDIKIEA